MATTYPTTPSTLNITTAFAGAILRDYRESGFVQGTAVVRDVHRSKRSADVYRVLRKIDFKTVSTLSAAGAQTALVDGDTVQVIPLSAGDEIVGGTLRVVRAASAGTTNTLTVKVGATALSAAVSTLATGTTVFTTGVPLAVTSDDTVDFLVNGTVGPVFDSQVELVVLIAPARG